MYSSPRMVDAFDALGVIAPECAECEGNGAVAYTHGPYEHLRECDVCQGAGHRIPRPNCIDGTSPENGDTCRLCQGFAALF